ncbi:MAG: hypothetical protein KAV87_10640 [Desulfobacteraceae bacterium]|nr:hypothetical protein [Desulfobacteraceae bacterium]
MSDSEKYKELFLAAKEYIDNNPCDPDITDAQIQAWIKYQALLEKYNVE